MKSTKACALAVAGESWLEVILELLFMAYNRKRAVGILLLRGMAVNGLANIEELILVLEAPHSCSTGQRCKSQPYIRGSKHIDRNEMRHLANSFQTVSQDKREG
jgi:hypothetical protein